MTPRHGSLSDDSLDMVGYLGVLLEVGGLALFVFAVFLLLHARGP